MGIRDLNSYLKKKCTSESITQQHLSKYENKKIVVDIFIYLYKFLGEGTLMEHTYLLITIFKKYNIIPLFVFDGKSPPEKAETITKRKNERNIAKDRYNEVMLLLKNDINNKKYENDLKLLKKQMVSVNNYHIKLVKQLMDNYGVSYIVSEGESDALCAELVRSGKMDYCLSDDTDMLLYNCPLVLRNINLIEHTVYEYNTNNILKEINMSFIEFSEVVVLSGTDYNKGEYIELKLLIKEYNDYKNNICNETFYEWLVNKNYNIDIAKVQQIKQIYMDNINKININILLIENKTPNYEQLYKDLEKNGFMIYSQ